MVASGIKRILFADISKITADITPEIAKTLIQAAITAKDEVSQRKISLSCRKLIHDQTISSVGDG